MSRSWEVARCCWLWWGEMAAGLVGWEAVVVDVEVELWGEFSVLEEADELAPLSSAFRGIWGSTHGGFLCSWGSVR